MQNLKSLAKRAAASLARLLRYLPALMDAVPARHDPYASLRIPNFRRFILSLLMMNMATQLQTVVVSWQVYALTHDPLSLGLIGPAEALPFIGFALPAGHLADRVRRLTIARIALMALLGCSAALLWFTLQPALVHSGRVWPIYGVIFLSGIARSFLQPARTALSAEVVPRALYPNAVTWRSSTWQLAAVLGPALGGLIYGFGMFSVLLGGATALRPVFADQILHVGPEGLGVLRAGRCWSTWPCSGWR